MLSCCARRLPSFTAAFTTAAAATVPLPAVLLHFAITVGFRRLNSPSSRRVACVRACVRREGGADTPGAKAVTAPHQSPTQEGPTEISSADADASDHDLRLTI